jgi:hypothetical protein
MGGGYFTLGAWGRHPVEDETWSEAESQKSGKSQLMPGWSEAVDEGDKHRGSQRPGQVESHLW